MWKKFAISGSEFTKWFLELFEDSENYVLLLLTLLITDILRIWSRINFRYRSSQFKTACSQRILTNEHPLF
jgi:hypothetical protein